MKRKEADVVTSCASDRGSKVELDRERLQGRGAGFFHAMPACPPTHLGRWDSGTLVPAGWVCQTPGQGRAGQGRQVGTQAGAGAVAARSAANDSNGAKSVTGNGPPPKPHLKQLLLYLQSTVAAAFGAVRYF